MFSAELPISGFAHRLPIMRYLTSYLAWSALTSTPLMLSVENVRQLALTSRQSQTEAVMPVWSVPDASTEPDISISDWQIFETQNGSRHFVGTNVREHTGRVSTAIQELDLTLLRGVTSSGRVYQLVGPRGSSADGRYIWEHWCIVNGISSYTDVTTDVLAEGKI